MSRAYKNKKYNKDNYIKFGVGPKYFGLQAKRFPGSVKKAYCDIDRDDEAEVFFTKRRSPAVRKNYDCLLVSNFAPIFGPQDFSQAAPEIGPADLEANVFPAPTSGPQDLVAEAPEQIYTVVSFADSNFGNLYGEPDGRWYPKEVDDAAIYLGEDAPYKYYAFPLIEGQRFTIVPETQAAYYSNVSRGSGVGNNLWEWYWYKYRPTGGYLVSGSAESKVKYNSYSVNPNLGNPKFSLWFSYPNAYLRDLQYNPYNRFKESDVMAMKSSLEAGEGTGFAVGSTMRINPEYTEDFRTHHSSTPPNPY